MLSPSPGKLCHVARATRQLESIRTYYMNELKPGDKVRVKTNHSRVGILTAEVDGPSHRQ